MFWEGMGMKIKFFLLSSFIVVFSTLNCMLAIKVVDGRSDIAYLSRHDGVSHRLDLGNLGITEDSLDAIFVEMLCFINNNKVEFLSLEKNSFAKFDLEFIKKMTGLLASSPTLKSISLKNNFKHASGPERSFVLSPQVIELLTSAIGQFQALFKDSLAEASQQVGTEYITKEILLDDMPPLSIISEIKLPLTGCERFRAFLVRFSVGLASVIVSTGGTILTLYLSGNFGGTGCPCPSNSTLS